MLRSASCIAVALMLAPAMGSAQDFDAGQAAFDARDYAVALHEWVPLAQQGDARAQNILGFMYEEGTGVPQDYALAMSWYRKAAEQGDAWSQGNLGLMYQFGKGVRRDYVSAHMWFNLASRNGEAPSAFMRDDLAAEMAPDDISEAQRRAWVCLASIYQYCG